MSHIDAKSIILVKIFRYARLRVPPTRKTRKTRKTRDDGDHAPSLAHKTAGPRTNEDERVSGTFSQAASLSDKIELLISNGDPSWIRINDPQPRKPGRTPISQGLSRSLSHQCRAQARKARSASAISSASFSRGNRCEYRSIVNAIVECPMRSWTDFGGSPRPTSSRRLMHQLANQCRRQCRPV